MSITVITILWGGAFSLVFVDNIFFVETIILLVQEMRYIFNDLNPIWWFLILGIYLGGNGILVRTSANLMVASMVEISGYKISFKDFMKIGLLVMIFKIIVSNIYIWFRYL